MKWWNKIRGQHKLNKVLMYYYKEAGKTPIIVDYDHTIWIKTQEDHDILTNLLDFAKIVLDLRNNF